MFSFARPRPHRRPNLTPMIDVVFLLLVFFMLAAQFGRDAALPLTAAGGGAAYDGPPRLVDIAPETLMLNGVAVAEQDVAGKLEDLTKNPQDMVVLRALDGATLQRLVNVASLLRAAGFTRLAVVE